MTYLTGYSGVGRYGVVDARSGGRLHVGPMACTTWTNTTGHQKVPGTDKNLRTVPKIVSKLPWNSSIKQTQNYSKKCLRSTISLKTPFQNVCHNCIGIVQKPPQNYSSLRTVTKIESKLSWDGSIIVSQLFQKMAQKYFAKKTVLCIPQKKFQNRFSTIPKSVSNRFH